MQAPKILKIAITSLACGLIEMVSVLLWAFYIMTAKPNGFIEILGYRLSDLSIILYPLIFLMPIILLLLSIASLVLGITSLMKIRKNSDFRGKRHALIGVLLGILAPIFYLTLSLLLSIRI